VRRVLDPHRQDAPAPAAIVDLPGVRGTLRVSLHPLPAAETPAARPARRSEAAGGVSSSVRHRTTFVNGPDGTWMEDNDIRGYLDGTFKYAWNQPGQVHVRIGRRGDAPRYGEHELFRVLYRWDPVALAPGARVLDARFVVTAESSPDAALRFFLYRVQHDWNPGHGGTRHDNVSPPVPGEVWWNEASHTYRPWSLPGAGYAAEGADADTAPMPLADALLPAHGREIVLNSPTLTDYLDARVAARQPLLFLLKLADYQEDQPGTFSALYSGDHGDSRNVARRPRLELEWEGPIPNPALERALFLEHGRVLQLGRWPLHGPHVLAASFESLPGYTAPAIEVRTSRHGASADWSPLTVPRVVEGEAVELRLLAAVDPIRLGAPFYAELHDTWVRSGPPETQRVPWTFLSPTGATHEVLATYAGAHRWTVEFRPDELGAWRYAWSQRFTDTPYRSAEGRFDVIADDPATVERGLADLLERLRHELPSAEGRGAHDAGPARTTARMVQFARLERAAMQLQTPETYRSPGGIALRARLNEVRALLQEAAPDPIPMVPDPGPSVP
jgi:hypothetical protein